MMRAEMRDLYLERGKTMTIMKSFHSRWLGTLGALALCSAGCTGDTGVAANGDTDAADTDDTDEPGDSLSSTTGTDPDTTSGETNGAESEGGNFIDPATDDEGTNEPMPNGAECSANSDCQSEFCYLSPLGGVCSECLSDSDCDATCSLDFNVGYAICTDGSLGKMCDSDEGCQDELVCATLIDAGIFQADFCSECNDSGQCDNDDICSPHYDEGSFSGYLYCAEPGSVDDGGGCPIEGNQGNGEVCTNGHCGIANIMGFVNLGICGSCSTNDDCEDGESCVPASADGGLQGAYCD
jgi:hypothetical protein